jgi:methionine-rich copper-binding protein CopC
MAPLGLAAWLLLRDWSPSLELHVEREGAFCRSLPDLNAFLIGAVLRFLTTFEGLSSSREQEEASMRIWLLALGLAAMPLWPAQSAGTIDVVESHPAKGESLDGRSEDFFVRFSGPVDHYTSRLFIAQSGNVLVTLNPRLDTEPDTLFARREPLSPGDYELSWLAYTGTGEKIGGIVLFSVRTGGRQ